jgi:hypothetical protein
MKKDNCRDNIIPEIGDSKSFKIINVDKNVVNILDKKKGLWIDSNWINDALIERMSENVIRVTGYKLDKDFAFRGRLFLEDFTNQSNLPLEEYRKFGYKNIIDFIRGIKKEYVEDFFELEKQIKCEFIISNFIIKKTTKTVDKDR